MDTTATYIVTGCTGYLGNVLAKKLMREGCRVVGLAQSEKKAERVFGADKPTLVFGDITDKATVAKLFDFPAPFVVIHTAAKISIGGEPVESLAAVTVGGTKNVVELCLERKVKKLIHISSTQTIPVDGVKSTVDESFARANGRARGAYAVTKRQADEIVLAAVEQGLNASILMPASILGPGDYSNSHMTQMLIDFARGKLPASVNGGYNDFDVRDLADVLPAIIDNSVAGEYYIFANKPDKLNEVLNVAASVCGRKPPLTLPLWVAYAGLPFLWLYSRVRGKRPLYTRTALYCLKCNANFSITKAREAFGFSPRPLEQTVRDHIEFLRDEGLM